MTINSTYLTKIVTSARAAVTAVTIGLLLTAAIAPELQAMNGSLGNQGGGDHSSDKLESDPRNSSELSVEEKNLIESIISRMVVGMQDSQKPEFIEGFSEAGKGLHASQKAEAYPAFADFITTNELALKIMSGMSDNDKIWVMTYLARIGQNLSTVNERNDERANVLTHVQFLITNQMSGVQRAEIIYSVGEIGGRLTLNERNDERRNVLDYALNPRTPLITDHMNGFHRAQVMRAVANVGKELQKIESRDQVRSEVIAKAYPQIIASQPLPRDKAYCTAVIINSFAQLVAGLSLTQDQRDEVYQQFVEEINREGQGLTGNDKANHIFQVSKKMAKEVRNSELLPLHIRGGNGMVVNGELHSRNPLFW